MNLIIPVLYFFLNTTPIPEGTEFMGLADDEIKVIFIVKQRWHTGIVINRNDVDTLIWNEVNDFKNAEWIDIGWGDKEFYQYPGFDLGLAVQALFYPTESTLRVEGFNFPIERYIKISDLVIEIKIDDDSFDKLCMYISSEYEKDDQNEPIIISEKYGGNIKFYEAEQDYHLFNTCNTWVAKGFEYAGFDIPTNIILVEQLFKEAQEFGKVVKAN